MASPFPGMDPYLEGDLWQEFHDRLANQICAQLMPRLAPRYVALLAKRYVLDRPGLGVFKPPEQRTFYPDVPVARTLRERQVAALPPGVMAPTVELASPVVEELPLLGIEIRDVAERRLGTVIEVLAPVNKRGEGAREYHDHRLDLLRTDAHLLEIDLLTQGVRIQLRGEPPAAPYYVYLSRAGDRPFTQVWAIQLAEPLPTVPAPLLYPDPDVALDLQAALAACFELVGYERLLDYGGDPPAGLSPAERAWAQQRVAGAAFRRGVAR